MKISKTLKEISRKSKVLTQMKKQTMKYKAKCKVKNKQENSKKIVKNQLIGQTHKQKPKLKICQCKYKWSLMKSTNKMKVKLTINNQ